MNSLVPEVRQVLMTCTGWGGYPISTMVWDPIAELPLAFASPDRHKTRQNFHDASHR